MTSVVLTAAPAALGWVEVSLIGSGGKVDGAVDPTDDTVLLPRQARVKLDAAGSATIALRPTGPLLPAGTVYRATFTGNGTSESLTFGGFSGAGPVNAADFIVDPPGALASPALTLHAAAADPHPGYTTAAELTAAVNAAVAGVIAGAPGALDTLDELAAALGDDANFAATVTTALAGKVPSATLTADGDLFTRTAGVIARITRAQLAADAAFSGSYERLADGGHVYVTGLIDGSAADQTAAVTAAVALLPSTSGELRFPAGTYSARILLPNKRHVVVRGMGQGATIIKGPISAVMTLPSGTPRGDVTYEDITFDLGASTVVAQAYPDDHTISFHRCTFDNITSQGLASLGSLGMVVEDCTFQPATIGAGTAMALANGTRGFRWRRNKIRYMANGFNLDASPHDDIVVEDSLFEGGWYLLPVRTGGAGSGGTVTYTATTVTDTAAAFPTFATPTTVNIRALPVLSSGAATVSYFYTRLTDTAAGFVAAGLQPGHIVRAGGLFGVIAKVVSATELWVEEWLDSTYKQVANPVNGTAYTAHRVLMGLIVSNTATAITVERWFDVYDGATVLPAAGTLYEVLPNRPQYQGLHAAAATYSSPGGVKRITVDRCTFLRGWNDQLSIYGSDCRAKLRDNHIEGGYDFGITCHSPRATIRGNVVCRQGAAGIASTGARSLVAGNQCTSTPIVNTVNTVYLGDILVTGNRTLVLGNVVEAGGPNPRYGIVVNGDAVDTAVSCRVIGNITSGYSVGGIRLNASAAGAVSGTYLRDNDGTLSQSANVTGTDTGATTPGVSIHTQAPSGTWVTPLVAALSAFNFADGIARIIPIDLPPCTIDRLGFEVTAAGTAGTAKTRVMAWFDNAGVPGAVAADGGQIASDSIGAKNATVSIVHPGGILWVAAVNQGGAAAVATLRFISAAGSQMINAAQPTTGLVTSLATTITGAPPANPATALNWTHSFGPPLVSVRIA